MDDLEIGSEAVGAKNAAEMQAWENRPMCCDKKVDAFDDDAYICGECEKIFE